MKICVMVKRYCPLQTADFLIMQYHGVDGSRKSRKPLHKSKELFLNNRKKGLFKKNECVENCDCDDKQIIQLTKKYNNLFLKVDHLALMELLKDSISSAVKLMKRPNEGSINVAWKRL